MFRKHFCAIVFLIYIMKKEFLRLRGRCLRQMRTEGFFSGAASEVKILWNSGSHSEYEMTGDQPQAVERLVSGFKSGKKHQTLLGVTGSGKTFTMANVIQQMGKPTLVICSQ